MERKDYLQSLLVGESRAYGFTIAFWGSGAILIGNFGIPELPQALGYGAGAVTGFGLLTILAFDSISETVEPSKNVGAALSMIHYLAALLPILIAELITYTVSNSITAFFLSGASVSMVYNSLSVLEEHLAELLNQGKNPINN